MNPIDRKLWTKGQENLESLMNEIINNVNRQSISDIRFGGKLAVDNRYLYLLDYNDIDYDYAYAYLKGDSTGGFGACSSCWNGNFYGRNFDWFYSDDATFVIRTPRLNGRYASGGVTYKAGLSAAIAESGKYSDIYKILPFVMLDGENEYKLFANTNVAPVNDTTLADAKGKVIANPDLDLSDSQNVELCGIMLVRYVLDHFKTTDEVIDFLQNHARVYMPEYLIKMNEVLHFMFGSRTGNKCYVAEIINNQFIITESNAMTNFFINGVTFSADGKVSTPETYIDNKKPSDMGITPHGAGLERWNIIKEYIADVDSVADMQSLMNRLLYTRMYNSCVLDGGHANPKWYSEMVGVHNTTVDSPVSEYEAIETLADELYLTRSRTGSDTWQTCHSSVYDLDNFQLHILSQEGTFGGDDMICDLLISNDALPSLPTDDKEYTLKVKNGKLYWDEE